MDGFLLSLLLLLAGGIAAWACGRNARAASLLGAGSAVAAALAGLTDALRHLLGVSAVSLRWPWAVPFGEFHLGIDPLSGLFLVMLYVVAALAAVYGTGYLRDYAGRFAVGRSWFFFNLLVASLAVVFTARNGVLFLAAWEVMSLASFALVVFEHTDERVRRAGWLYLIAAHVGMAFLLAFFLIGALQSGGMDVTGWSWGRWMSPAMANTLFVLAVIGFGTKAGFMPLHIWLPEAHPAAPSHVSALMSGVLIKAGVYGLVRALSWFGAPPLWWGCTLIALGLASGVAGLLYAMAQSDLKRLLAYSSVENVGIITVGLGVGLVGASLKAPLIAALGYGGALLHALNHSLYKSLLFLAAGSIRHAAGTLNLNRLGGLLKAMPWTGAAFFAGALAISGLPPLNGFVSEFLLLFAGLKGAVTLPPAGAVPLLAAAGGLALIAGLAVATFANAFGMAFLGLPRTPAHAHEGGWSMRLPPILLATACALLALGAPAVVQAVGGAVRAAFVAQADIGPAEAAPAIESVTALLAGGLALAVLTALAYALRALRVRRHAPASSPTWDCGYARPAPSMQYTAASFADPILSLFRHLVRRRISLQPPQGPFPAAAAQSTEAPDLFHARLFRPGMDLIASGLGRFRWIQHGRMHLYVLYVAVAVVAVLVWSLRK